MSQPLLGRRPADRWQQGPESSAVPLYLTDGATLYRALGGLNDEVPPMVILEDCRTLDVLLLQAEVTAKLRRVWPSGEEEPTPSAHALPATLAPPSRDGTAAP